MRTSFSESNRAQLAQLLACRVPLRVGTQQDTDSLYTPACTGERSIDQRYSQLGTRWNTHSYLHLTCIGCGCGRRIGGCSCCSGRWSSFHPAFCSVGDGRTLWLHVAAMPGGPAHMSCTPQLRNESCRRKAARPEISLASTHRLLHQHQTNPCINVYLCSEL